MSLEMVTRAEWGAMPPRHLKPLEPPVTQVAFVHAATLNCHDKEECCQLMRFMQRCCMGVHEMADMKHNFYIASDGTVYEGRGWLKNTSNYDPNFDIYHRGKFITIARIGLDFPDDPPTPEQLAAKEAIIKHGIEQKYISPEYLDVKGLFYQYYVDGCPPEDPDYEVWKPPPCSEKERTFMHRCTTNSAWEEMMKGLPDVDEKMKRPEKLNQEMELT